MNTPTSEHFYRRGLLDKLSDTGADGQPKDAAGQAENHGQKPGFKFGGHFAGIPLDATKMEMERWPYLIPGPAMSPRPTSIERIETVLTERAESLGVEIARGCGVTNILTQDDDNVTIEAGEDRRVFRAKWLVGCDGGRSNVRHSAGFDFPGTEPTFTGYMAECEWDSADIKPGWHYHAERGMYMVRPPSMLYLADFDGGRFDRSRELSKETMQEVLRRLSGVRDVNVTNVGLSSTFTDRCKQATSYRRGRVLLAGDAAHIHSPLGAQGLNLGIGDAMNLGWKLAATIQLEAKTGSADLTLLDTYTTERHPIGAWVLQWQRTQVAAVKPDPWGAATRKITQQMIDTKDGANLFIDRFWGLSLRYDLALDGKQVHDLVGASMPDFEFNDGGRLGTRLTGGKGYVVVFIHDAELETLVKSVYPEGQMQYIYADVKDSLGLDALFVRPDGVVAWARENHGGSPAKSDLEVAEAALRRWAV
jgi:2-polyprenyl-6-methoxyphenol hydroxylase-like FAD-dependent oxidoreductase